MPAAAVLALALLAADSSRPVNRTASPLVISITTASDASRFAVEAARAEAAAIFRSAGVSFVWRDGHDVAASLVVVIGNALGPTRESGTPLGWLVFEGSAPTNTIYLSYANAERYLLDAREVVGALNNKTRAERDTLLGRVMGRALAHELGHYLLGTKEHTARGLLKRAPTAAEFFSPDRGAFTIDAAERSQIAARLSGSPVLARREIR